MKKTIAVESLFGNEVAPARIVRAGMKGLEKELELAFKNQQEKRRVADKHYRTLHRSVLSSLGENAKNAAAVKALKAISVQHSKIGLRPPTMPKHKQRIFAGSIAATVAPPFNYQWTWNAFSGSVDVLNVMANAANGRMGFDIDSNNHCACSARVAVGIFFRPITDNGILFIWANPAINYNWFDICAFDSTHSDGFLGLYVGSYDLSGGFAGAPVNQQISLWNDSSWWSGGSDSGGNSGYPLFAPCIVDSSHWYALWVWCGGNIQADGWGTFSGSGAGATLSVAVPSITWELF